MKWILMLALSMSLNAFAQQNVSSEKSKMKQKTFEERKSKMLAHLEKRINALNESKACVQNAKDQQALKGCRKTIKEKRKSLKKKKSERKAMKNQN